jgi:Bax protein
MSSTLAIRRLAVVVFVAVFCASSAACGEIAPPPVDSVESAKPDVQVETTRPEERFEFTSYTEVGELFEELGYTPETWQAGIREVPRVFLTTIAPRWRDRVSKDVSVLEKKRIFFRSLAPLVLRSNEFILRDRARAFELRDRMKSGGEISADDRQWLAELAVGYGVTANLDATVDAAALDELMVRVDVVPVSLALGQCAEESGWGTSRFAAEGNALFGQWSWGGKGIKPQQQREGMGDYRIAAFETPLQSVMAYIRNLNTHAAYAGLRARRAEMRAKGDRISGWELAKSLDKYSERGPAYVESLHGIMKVNRLDAADDAFLGDGPTIWLIPVGEGTS